ncbi:EamA family transporter [Paraburkholderia sp. NMBU_R16]|uniref:DMT family transporter n=1 Tax=Paraburkholderia sp. NMBU_R16 TaxID=2698676 RepID=UPI001567B0C2|nr:EamA family transporter [Paraburkholderia sp. NMBU_R16]NRO95297.1 EamA family transporter [Paraburkholderia sp. NMBU_R16]
MSTTSRSVKPGTAISILLCPVSLAGMGMFVKSTKGVPESALLLARFGVPALIYWGLLSLKRYPFTSIRPHKHLLRAALGFLSVCCLFAAIARVPLSTALCLSYTLPFFAYAISLISGRERLDARGVFVIGALAGVACMTNPNAHADVTGMAFALASALFGAIALYEIKRVARSEDSDAVLVMYFTISTIGLTIYMLFFDKAAMQTVSPVPWGKLALIGICGLLYQVGLVTSLKEVSVSLVSMFLLFSVAISFVGDLLLFKSAFTFAGTIGLAILAASILCFQYCESAARKRREPA